MRPEDVPADLVRIATEGLAGCEVRGILANTIPEIERRVREQVAAERQVTEQLIEQVLTPERARCKEATERAETAERLAAFYRQQIDAPADLLARVDAAEAAITEKDAEIRQLRRQVMGYRDMKDVYLTERNEAYRELIKDENLIERLCDDREAGQSMAKAALTEQRERAEQAERERDEYRERFTNQMTAAIALVEKLQQAEAAVRRVRALLDPYPEGAVFAIHRGVGSERRVQAVLPSDVVRAALDAEQPEETP